MTFDFNKALEVPLEEIQRAPALPVGIYIARVSKPHSTAVINTSDGFSMEKVTIYMIVTEAAEDGVDADALEAFGPVYGTPLQRDFLFSNNPDRSDSAQNTMVALKKFLKQHLRAEGDNVKELLANMVNCSCKVIVGHELDKNDKEVVYARIKSTMPE